MNFNHTNCIGAAVLVTLFLPVAGCFNKSSEQEKPSEQELETFLNQSIQHLVYVEGGSFIMGDGGWEVTDQDGNKTVQRMTGDSDDEPGHQVTLNSYSVDIDSHAEPVGLANDFPDKK